MGELKYPQNSSEWAWQKGIKRKCKHGEYDPNIGCSKCREEERKREEREKVRKRKLKETFENVIWPDKTEGG